jgi:hypothetical protein
MRGVVQCNVGAWRQANRLSAVQLWTLRSTGAHLPRLRPRQPILRGVAAHVGASRCCAPGNATNAAMRACARGSAAPGERQTQEATHHGSPHRRLGHKANSSTQTTPREPCPQQRPIVEPQPTAGRLWCWSRCSTRCSVCGRALSPFARLLRRGVREQGTGDDLACARSRSCACITASIGGHRYATAQITPPCAGCSPSRRRWCKDRTALDGRAVPGVHRQTLSKYLRCAPLGSTPWRERGFGRPRSLPCSGGVVRGPRSLPAAAHLPGEQGHGIGPISASSAGVRCVR